MSKGSTARATIVGRMGGAIEVKNLSNDNRVGNVRLATTSGYGDKATTHWHNVTIYDKKKIEILETYTDKGSRLFVEGELRNRSYEKNGDTKWVTEIVVAFDGVVEIIDGRKDGNEAPTPAAQTRARPQPAGFTSYDDDLDSDIPF